MVEGIFCINKGLVQLGLLILSLHKQDYPTFSTKCVYPLMPQGCSHTGSELQLMLNICVISPMENNSSLSPVFKSSFPLPLLKLVVGDFIKKKGSNFVSLGPIQHPVSLFSLSVVSAQLFCISFFSLFLEQAFLCQIFNTQLARYFALCTKG